jgi:LuxR family maltose regulon positive regulatory protein
LLAQRRLSELRRWLARLERFARERALYRWLIGVHVLQAVVAEWSRDRALACDRLSLALHRAAPQDYLQVFLNEGGMVQDLLPDVRSVAPAFVDRLLEMFNVHRAGLTPDREGMSVPSPGPDSLELEMETLIEPLSKRELEVLGLIAAGLSNREISQELYIAVGTVKRHTNHIYGKLGVHSRTQAVARARALGLFQENS